MENHQLYNQVNPNRNDFRFAHYDECLARLNLIDQVLRQNFWVQLILSGLLILFTLPAAALNSREYGMHVAFSTGLAMVVSAAVVAGLSMASLRRIPFCLSALELFYAACAFFQILPLAPIFALPVSCVGFASALRASLYLKDLKKLKEMEGYPQFIRRIDEEADYQPLHTSASQRDSYYMDSLTNHTLRGEPEVAVKIEPSISRDPAPDPSLRTELLADMDAIPQAQETEKQALPSLEEVQARYRTMGKHTAALAVPSAEASLLSKEALTSSEGSSDFLRTDLSEIEKRLNQKLDDSVSES